MPGDLLAPLIYPQPYIDQLKKDLSHEVFLAQYMQMPKATTGAILSLQHFMRYTKHDLQLLKNNPKTIVLQSWDTGMGSGFSVCTTWYALENCYYLVDVARFRSSYAELKARFFALKKRYDPDYILIEESAFGAALLSEVD